MSLDSIMTGLEGLSPTYDSNVEVRVWAYDNIKDVLDAATCPVRLIGLNDDKQSASLELYNLNNKDRAEWNILDRLYIMGIGESKGVTVNNRHILAYTDSYMSAVSADKCLSAASSDDTRFVRNVSFTAPYQIDYPEGSGNWFWVVDAVVTVEEYR